MIISEEKKANYPYQRLEKTLVGLGFSLRELESLELPELYTYFAIEWERQLKELEAAKNYNGGI